DEKASFTLTDLCLLKRRRFAPRLLSFGFELLGEIKLRPGVHVIEKIVDHLARRVSQTSIGGLLIGLDVVGEISADARAAIEIAHKRSEVEHVEKVSGKICRYDRIRKIRSRTKDVRHRDERSDQL